MDLKYAYQKLQQETGLFLKQLQRDFQLKNSAPALYRALADYLNRPAKKIRPLLFLAAYEGTGGKKNNSLYGAAFAFELLHNFSLIHDDIIDQAKVRRGGPAMQLLFAQHEQNKRKINTDAALLAGDILFALGIEKLRAINFSAEKKDQLLQLVLNTAVRTGLGELAELTLNINQVKKINKTALYQVYDGKTGYYTFSTPLTAGALLADSSKKTQKQLYQAGIYLGRAFQIEDDLLAFSQKGENKPLLNDLQNGRITIVLSNLLSATKQNQKNEIYSIYKKKEKTIKDLQKLKELFILSGANKITENEIRQNKKSGLTFLEKSGLKKVVLAQIKNILQLTEL